MQTLDDLVPPDGWQPDDGSPFAQATAQARWLPAKALAAAASRATDGRTVNVFRLLGVNRRLYRPLLLFNGRLMPGGALPRAETELVILRVAWRVRSRYEWEQHRRVGARAGLTEEDVRTAASGPDTPGLGPRRAALLRAADELLDDRAIRPATLGTLKAEGLPDAHVIELCLLVGNYAMLAGVLSTFHTPLEEG